MTQKIERHTLIGIIAGLGAGAFWGLPFVVPLILSDFNGLEVSLGRFFFFAVASLFSLIHVSRSTIQILKKYKWTVLALAIAGFSGYSTLLFFAVQLIGGVVSSVVIGLIPITVSLYGLKEQKLGRRGIMGLLMIAIGILFIQNENLKILSSGAIKLQDHQSWGLIMLVICLLSWSWYAVQNSVFLKRHPEIKASEWTALMGLISFGILMLFIPLATNYLGLEIRYDLALTPKIWNYLFWVILLGVGSSYISNWLWSYTSKYLPASISGQLIVSETCFGLLFTYLFEKRFPAPLELGAIVVFILGVTSTISGLKRR